MLTVHLIIGIPGFHSLVESNRKTLNTGVHDSLPKLVLKTAGVAKRILFDCFCTDKKKRETTVTTSIVKGVMDSCAMASPPFRPAIKK